MGKRIKRAVDENHPVVRAIRWILDNKQQPDGKPWSQRALSKAAGLNGVHIQQILSGYQTPNIAAKTANGLAAAAGVSPDWILNGVGSPGEEMVRPVVELDEQYPNRARAVAAARALGSVPEEAIEQVLSVQWKGADMTPDEWLDELRSAARRLRGRALATRDADGLDDDPPALEIIRRSRGK